MLTQNEAMGAATASDGGSAPIASFWVRIMTSCISIKRGVYCSLPWADILQCKLDLCFFCSRLWTWVSGQCWYTMKLVMYRVLFGSFYSSVSLYGITQWVSGGRFHRVRTSPNLGLVYSPKGLVSPKRSSGWSIYDWLLLNRDKTMFLYIKIATVVSAFSMGVFFSKSIK